MTRRLNQPSPTNRWSSPRRDEGGHFLETEKRRRIRLAVVVAVVIAIVLTITALVAGRDDTPQIELIDVEASSAIAVTDTQIESQLQQSSPVGTNLPAVASSTAGVAPAATVVDSIAPATSAVATTVAAPQTSAPPATFVQASIGVPPADAADFPGVNFDDEVALAAISLRVLYPVRTPTAEEPLRLYVGGDSLSDAPRVGLERAGAIIDVHADTRISTGLVADWYFDWVDRIETRVAVADHEVVVLTFGGNDAQPLGGDAPVGTDEWRTRYAARVEAVAQALSDGPQVVWIGLPPVTPENIQVIVPVVNEILSDAASRWSHIDYLDASSLFAGPEGGFKQVLPDVDGKDTLVRAQDGVHYTPAAGDWMAQRILEFVEAKMLEPGSVYPTTEPEG